MESLPSDHVQCITAQPGTLRSFQSLAIDFMDTSDFDEPLAGQALVLRFMIIVRIFLNMILKEVENRNGASCT